MLWCYIYKSVWNDRKVTGDTIRTLFAEACAEDALDIANDCDADVDNTPGSTVRADST